MKKLLVVLLALVMMLTFVGCKKSNNDNDNKPKPNNNNNTPEPPKQTKLISKIGTSNDIEDAMKKFNEKFEDWSAFRMYTDAKKGSAEYGVWDDSDIYAGNFESYANHGYMPTVYIIAYYPEGKTEGDLQAVMAWLPYENIDDVDEDRAEGIVYWQNLMIKAVFPDLKDDEVKKVVNQLALTLEDGFEAYRKGQSDPSEFTGTEAEIYPSEDGKAYNVTCGYDDEYNTFVFTFTID